MNIRNAIALTAACLAAPAFAADPASTVLLQQALAAQGGEQLLRDVKTVAFDAAGYRNMLEQSIRPEGPYLVTFLDVAELHDHAAAALRRQTQMHTPPSGTFAITSLATAKAAMQDFGGRKFPGTAHDLKVAAEALALSPERLLLTALEAPDTHREADTRLNGLPHNVLSFTLDGAPVRIYLNQYSHLPSAVDYSGPLARGGYAAYLGDVVRRVAYGFWRLDASGMRYPMQWDVQVNGMADQVLMLRSLKVNVPADPALTTIPADLLAAFRPDGPSRNPEDVPLGAKQVEIEPGIVQVLAQWNVVIVDQGDGLVIIEAPISSNYSGQVLAEAARRYPGKPVKAMVTTSDSWPHLAGIREYAARGIAIYALDASGPIVKRTLAAAYTQRPDLLQKHPKKAMIHWVSGKTVIGSGPNRIELYPMRGAETERQMMAYFPGHKLLYGSDPFQKGPDGYTSAQPVSELVQAVEREHLDVERFFMFHLPVTPYRELLSVPGTKD
jgi:hypothetical protein